jgi:2-dehydropantoate 2-reductase
MKTLVVGIGALGGIIAARLLATGSSVALATRNAASAAALKAAGLHVTGIGGSTSVTPEKIAPLDDYPFKDEKFELIVLATKAYEAMEIAPKLSSLLCPGGVLVPIQNGGVSQMIADRFGLGVVLGGLSNLGATMTSPGNYEQRNAGHLLIGELSGGMSQRAGQVAQWLGQGVEVRVTPNMRGAIWSKLLLNCSVTTIGAVAGQTMREYISLSAGRELFIRAYDEALSVALASGTQPERMIVDPIPPNWNGQSVPDEAYEAWLAQVLNGYGDLKPSMLQDFERGRTTEIDFINGYVVDLGRKFGVATPANAAIVKIVHAITRGQISPDPMLLGQVLQSSR